PLLSTSGASRTSTTRVLPLAIISRACAGVIRGTAALAASIICLTLVAMGSYSLPAFHGPQAADVLRSLRTTERYQTLCGSEGRPKAARLNYDRSGRSRRA